MLSTKVGRYDVNSFDYSSSRVRSSIEESIERLGVTYIDLIVCHDIEFATDLDQIWSETIPSLLQLKEEGKVRAIGISGYPLEIFPYMVSCAEKGSIDFILSYCNFCMQNYRLLGTARGPPEWRPADEETKQVARQVNQLCQEHGVELATLALQYAFKEERIATTLVGIDSTETLENNLKMLQEDVDWDLVEKMRSGFDAVKNRRWISGKFIGNGEC